MRKTTATVAAATLATCQALSFSPAVASNFGESLIQPEARVSLNWTVPLGHVDEQELSEGDNGLSLRLDFGGQVNVEGQGREFIGSPVLDLRLNQLGYASVDMLGQTAWSSDPEIMKKLPLTMAMNGDEEQQQQYFYLLLGGLVIGGLVIMCVAEWCDDDNDGGSSSETPTDEETSPEPELTFQPVYVNKAFEGFY